MGTEEERAAHLRKISDKISHDQREYATDDPTRQAVAPRHQIIRLRDAVADALLRR